MAYFDESNFYPDTSPGYLVRVAHQLGVAALDRALAGDGITAVQWMALVAVHFGKAGTCAELARALAHDKGAMTRMIDQMEAAGWMARRRDEHDRRVIRLALTDAGRDAAMAARCKVIACWNGFVADWRDDEIETLIAMLHRLRATMEKDERCAA